MEIIQVLEEINEGELALSIDGEETWEEPTVQEIPLTMWQMVYG